MRKGIDRRLQRALLGDFALDNWHQHRVDRHAFTIYVGGDPHREGDWDGNDSEPGVEHHMADRLELNLHVLTNLSKTRPILILLASCGGLWDEGMQMAAAIATCPNPVTVLALKWARSMTSIIPLAADRFLMRPPAQFMFHHGNAAFAGLAGGELDTWKAECDSARQTMLDLYVDRLKQGGKHARKSPATIRPMLEKMMERKVDVWLTADEAVEWGFADGAYLGDVRTLRITRKNTARRQRFMDCIRRPRTPSVKGEL